MNYRVRRLGCMAYVSFEIYILTLLQILKFIAFCNLLTYALNKYRLRLFPLSSKTVPQRS
jgi:hypothetical protein